MNTTEHVMQAQPIDSTFSSTIQVAGKANYGAPLYKSITENSWLMNIAQDFAFATFVYTTSSDGSNYLFNSPIYPYIGSQNDILPWFPWFLSNYIGFKCDFDLVLEPVMHSAHRGVISVCCTINAPSTINSSEGFLPLENFDISGATCTELIYSLPNVYAYSGKMLYDVNRDLSSLPAGDTRLPYMFDKIGNVGIRAVTPLSSSNMLPSNINIILKLRPKIETLELFSPVLGASGKLSGDRMGPTWNNS